jgi:hypothetical protein
VELPAIRGTCPISRLFAQVDCSPTNNGRGCRRRPFQGVNNQYLQLFTRRSGLPKYGEIRVKRANHGWGIAGGNRNPGIAVDDFFGRRLVRGA